MLAMATVLELAVLSKLARKETQLSRLLATLWYWEQRQPLLSAQPSMAVITYQKKTTAGPMVAAQAITTHKRVRSACVPMDGQAAIVILLPGVSFQLPQVALLGTVQLTAFCGMAKCALWNVIPGSHEVASSRCALMVFSQML